MTSQENRLIGDPALVHGSVNNLKINAHLLGGAIPAPGESRVLAGSRSLMPESEKSNLAAVLSELLLDDAALGNGYVSPLPAAEGLVFTSAASPEVYNRLRAAERAFSVWYDTTRKDDRQERAYVTCRDHQVHKSTIVELLTKSACGSLTYVDELGSRLASLLCSASALWEDLSLIKLCKGSTDSSLIRSSATGGASIHSLKGDYAPAFNYFCSGTFEQVARVGHRISNSLSGSPALGSIIVIPVKVTGYPDPMFNEATLLLAMQAVYSKGRLRPEEKLQVVYESPELKAAWEEFLDLPVEAYVEREPTNADRDTYKMMPASTRTIALFASRAAMTATILESLEKSATTGVTLTWNSLKAAELFARLIFQVSSGEEKLAARRRGLAKAQASFKTPEKLAAAEQALLKAIQEAPGNRITRNAVRDIPGLTNGLLDELIKADKVAEIVTETKWTKVSRHYVLRESVQLEPEEAAAELEAAQEVSTQDPGAVTPDEAQAAGLKFD